MIFSPDLVEKVLAGEKTVTRLTVKRGSGPVLRPSQYKPRRTYAVQDPSRWREVTRIKIVSCYREVLKLPLSEAEARFEGFATPGDFSVRWVKLYGSSYPVDVWRIVFRLEP